MIDIRTNPDGSLGEIAVGSDVDAVHLERMAEDHWCLIINTADDHMCLIDLQSKAPISVHYVCEDCSDG